MSYQGKFFVKKWNTGLIDDTGETTGLCGLMIPPYSKVTRYWFHSWVVGNENRNWTKHMPYRMTGMYDIIPNNVDQTENFQDMTLEDYRTRYFAEGTDSGSNNDASWGDADDNENQEYDVDLPGGQPVTSVAKSQRVFHHEKMLGLPRNAMINGTDNIRYIDEFTRKGTVSNKGRPLEHAKMFLVVGGCDDTTTTQDVGDHLWGDSSNMSDLAEAVSGVFTDSSYDIASGMDQLSYNYPTLDKWYKMGFSSGSDNYDDSELETITRLTLEVKAYTPNNHNMISAP